MIQKLPLIFYKFFNTKKKITYVVISLVLICFTVVLTQTYLKALAAGYVSQAWTFASSGDYTLSDSAAIEVSSNTARLKVQNYTTDANTMGLWHLDESSGTTVDDASANNNDGTASIASWTTGNLNNAFSLDGLTKKISIPDSSSLSLSQSNTLEAWTKFGTAFSAGSTEYEQGIIDKGDYKLYYDNETGKVTYELVNTTETDWTQRAGLDINESWDLNGKLDVNSSIVVGSNIYVGLGNAAGDAEVWKWDGTIWEQVGGDAINSSWAAQTFETVSAMATDGTNLYIGIGITAGDAEVWYCNTSTGCNSWTKIGGDAINSSWAVGTYEYIATLTYMGSTLYAGTGSSANDAEVWSWNGSAWTKIGGDSINSGWTTNFETVMKLVNDGSTVYAALGSSTTDAEIWSWNGSAWTKIGGDGTNSSWNTDYEQVLTMEYAGTSLYAGLGNSANDAEVWQYTGGSWTKIGGDSTNSGWTTNYEGVYALESDGTNIYAGLGTTAGDNEVWRWNGSAWTKIGGDAINSGFTNTHTIINTLLYTGGTLYTGTTAASASGEFWTWNGSAWTRIGGNYINKSWGFYNLQSVEVMKTHNGKLYAGTGYTVAGNALVWEYDGSSWAIVGGQGVNSSWSAATYEGVFSMRSYNGDLYVGIGSTANDAEVWSYNGTTWTQVGGDNLNSGWNTGFETVQSMTVSGGYLYAGLGLSANDAEVWRWNGTVWEKVGGDSLNSGWTTNFEAVYSMTSYNGVVYAGIGNTAGDAEVWSFNGTAWTKIGGDSTNSGWASLHEIVETLIVHNSEIYAGLGTTAGDADLWKWDGAAWTQIGGDDIGGSWTAGTYERLRALASYNGDIYAGLGTTAGESEVWKYDGSTWAQVGGDALNSSWDINASESVHSLSVYKGKLYAGLGESANVDAAIWSYGNNGYLQSATTSQNTSWHHIAATYDGSTMKIYIDGTLDNSGSASLSIPNTAKAVLLGTTYGSTSQGSPQGFFNGNIDEVRISNTALPSFNTTAYSTSAQTIQNATAVFTEDIYTYTGFVVSETANGGAITYRLSNDGGTTWKYWDGGAWATSASTAQANASSTIDTNIDTFSISSSGIKWQAILDGDGTQAVTLNSITVEAEADTTNPNPPSSLTALNVSGGGTSLTTNTWYTYTTPYFSWSGASDTEAGVAGYYVYFGTDNTATPSTAGVFQVGTSYSASGLSSGSTYYLRIQAKDNAQNLSTVYAPFIYKFDNTNPSNPSTVTVTPSGYASTNSFTFSWPSSGDGIASDTGSGLAGYQYKTGAPSGDLSDWSSTTASTSIDIPSAAYQTGANTFYLRVIDTAGNVSATPLQATYYYGGDGPSAPQFLTATPSTNTTNSFAFSWQIPATYSGDSSDLTYCYTVNTLPSVDTCTYTSAGATSVSASSFATQVGLNTFYLVAKNGDDVGGTINYGSYTSVSFTANTSAPGIPLNLEISDVSIKSTSAWRLALSWTAPTDVGSGVEEYEIYRSSDDSTYTLLASTTGSAYIDTSLEQETYYYKVKACDSVSNCGASTAAVSLLPTGKFTEAAALESEPEVTGITTKQATITWSTDRASDSKIQFGTSEGDYFDEEPSNSTQVTAHEITLTNLSPGTNYYAVAKWTDEDGNTGLTDEFTFETAPAPTVTDPTAKTVGINSVILQYTVNSSSKVKIYYGKTSAFGGSVELSTSTSETTYNTTIDSLEDGTKYYYKINTFDTEGEEYEGSILSFETLPRPKIDNVKIQQVKGSAQPAVLVSWSTNTEVSSIITYYPSSDASQARDEVNVKLVKGVHRLLIKGLFPETPYTMVVKGIDKAGNQASSDPQQLTTATDTRPPLISNLRVEGNIVNTSEQVATAQLVVSWDTDEPGTSQVEFGEGTGTTYSQKTQEDSNLTYNHVVVISGLNTSKVYHLRALSKDKATNEAKSIDTVSITPKSSDSALNLVITNLGEVFGFLGGLKK